jgi:hypothetical protein
MHFLCALWRIKNYILSIISIQKLPLAVFAFARLPRSARHAAFFLEIKQQQAVSLVWAACRLNLRLLDETDRKQIDTRASPKSLDLGIKASR